MNENIEDKLIVALDVESPHEARELIARLRGTVGMFKVGSQLFTVAGALFVREIIENGARVFLDLKFHDIPNTVAAASREAARLGVSIFNMHAMGGSEMLKRAVEAVHETCTRENLKRPDVIAVTVLTSSDARTLTETGITSTTTEEQVVRLARLAATCGLDGVVASPHEIALIRQNIECEKFLIVAPGVRPANVAHDDQKRVMTPADAIRAGADYIVVGRAILKAEDPVKAAQEIIRLISSEQ
ncbi:MAG: orotidine-5'-phosphate decarboxylase [Pyrinomonadaceae bacterium]